MSGILAMFSDRVTGWWMVFGVIVPSTLVYGVGMLIQLSSQRLIIALDTAVAGSPLASEAEKQAFLTSGVPKAQ